MESFYATNAFRGDQSRQTMSTWESDDVCDVIHHSLSSRYDSGISSLPECSSFKSGLSSFGGPSRLLSGTSTLEEQMRRLGIGEVGANSALDVSCTSACSNACKSGVPLFQARGREADMEDMKPMVNVDLDLFQQDEDGDTQLHLSIIKPDPSLAFRIIEIGQFTDRLDIQNDHQQTSLHLAVITDQPHLVRALVVSGASLMARDKHGNTPLHLACKLGHAQCVERLTAPPSFEEEQYMCSERQRRGLSPQTMNYGRFTSSQISLLNYEGDTCLHLAMSSAAETKISILNYLLNICGADVNAQEGKCGFSLLHQAVRSRDVEMVKFLLVQPNILINQGCYNGYTPLDIAVSLNQIPLAQLLQSFGAVSFASQSGSELTEACQDEDFDDLIIAGGCLQR